MRIGIDVKVLAQKQRAGINIYTYYLIESLTRIDKGNEYFLYSNSDIDDSIVSCSSNFKIRIIPGKKKTIWMHFFLPKAIKEDGLDIFHSPDFLLPFNCACTTVITVHDIIPLIFPEKFPFKHRLVQNIFLPGSIRRSDRIITDSENTRNDIIKRFKNIENKITTVYPGVAPAFHPISDGISAGNLKRKYSINLPFLLYVGTIEPRKNIEKLIDAFSILKNRNINIQLVIAGSRGWFYQKIFKKIHSCKFKNDIRYIDCINDEELPVLYNAAEVFVFPSLYEGFGLPPLEAMACGIPVVVSNNSSLAEVVGDAGLLVNHESEEDIANAVEMLIKDEKMKDTMVKKGLKRAQEFTWDKMAHKILNIYRDIYNNAHSN